MRSVSVVDLNHGSKSHGDRLDLDRQRRSRLKMLVEHENLIHRLELALRGGDLLYFFCEPWIPGDVAARCDPLDLVEPRAGRQAHRRSEVAAPVNLVIVDTEIRRVPCRIVLEFHRKTERRPALSRIGLDIEIVTRIGHLIPGSTDLGNLALALELLRHELVNPRMAIHYFLARAVSEIERDWPERKPHRRLSAIRDVVVVRGHYEHRMTVLLFALKRESLVLDALKRRRHYPSLRVDLSLINPLDVRRSSPPCHQCGGLCAAVLVGEDDAVADLCQRARVLGLVPHQQRDVAESANRVWPRIEDRRERQGLVLWLVTIYDRNLGVFDVDG